MIDIYIHQYALVQIDIHTHQNRGFHAKSMQDFCWVAGSGEDAQSGPGAPKGPVGQAGGGPWAHGPWPVIQMLRGRQLCWKPSKWGHLGKCMGKSSSLVCLLKGSYFLCQSY